MNGWRLHTTRSRRAGWQRSFRSTCRSTSRPTHRSTHRLGHRRLFLPVFGWLPPPTFVFAKGDA